jgi:excisionase family DNA binding protein
MEVVPISNPFENLSNRLDRIESRLAEVQLKLEEAPSKQLVSENDEGDIELAIAITGLKRETIYNYVNKRTIPHSKVGGRLTFSRQQLLEYKESRTKFRSII